MKNPSVFLAGLALFLLAHPTHLCYARDLSKFNDAHTSDPQAPRDTIQFPRFQLPFSVLR